jgi:hypothetical protein
VSVTILISESGDDAKIWKDRRHAEKGGSILLTLLQFSASHLNKNGAMGIGLQRTAPRAPTYLSRATAITERQDCSYPESGLLPTCKALLARAEPMQMRLDAAFGPAAQTLLFELMHIEHSHRLVSTLKQVLVTQRTHVRLAKGHPYECHTD